MLDYKKIKNNFAYSVLACTVTLYSYGNIDCAL
jgi:hypothetical protein